MRNEKREGTKRGLGPGGRFVLRLSLLASLLAFQDPTAKVYQLTGPEGGISRIHIIENLERTEPGKKSPKHGWEFEWITAGLGRETAEENYRLRIRVFAQQKRQAADPAPLVCRMAMRLWDFNVRKLRRGHDESYDDGRVHFYLAFGGQPGGEQLFDEDEEGGRAKRVNTIYIYQIQNVKDPVELAREVAHEYGHATLWPVGGFTEPEPWANGYLGEKLYLRYLRDEFKAGRMKQDDVMGAPLDRLDAFVQREVDAMAEQVWLNGPDLDRIGGSGSAAMNAYLALNIYAYEGLPIEAYARSLKLIGSTHAKDYPQAVVASVAERESVVIAPPAKLAGKDVWIPLGKGKLTGAGMVKRQGDWALVRPLGGVIRVTND